MRILSVVFIALALLLASSCTGAERARESNQPSVPFSYEPWNQVLGKYVDSSGYVDYEGMERDSAFWQFITMINNAEPSRMGSEQEQLAFWINAYNALTVQLVVENMPLSSITDIAGGLTGVIVPGVKSPWELVVARIEGEDWTLQEIEDDRVRGLGDERIHFAINCASISCPKLMPKAYTAANMDELMDQGRREYLSNRRENYLKNGKLYLSKIFDWYDDDFARSAGTMRAYVVKYWPDATEATLINSLPENRIDFVDYNWGLVSQKNRR